MTAMLLTAMCSMSLLAAESEMNIALCACNDTVHFRAFSYLPHFRI